jgi:hypothetical protein
MAAATPTYDRSRTTDAGRDWPSPDRHRGWILAGCVVVVLVVYLFCSLSYGKSLAGSEVAGDFQTYQGDAFIHGQLDLLLPVPPGLVALPDPYNELANEQYRAAGLHDLTYYNGKLYTYYGPTPVILFSIPYHSLFGEWPSSTLTCLVFCAVGFLATVFAYRRSIRHFVGGAPVIVDALAVLALGLAGPMAWIIYIGRDYEASIAAGYAMIALGILFVARSLFPPSRYPYADMALASLFLAAAVGARASLLPALALLVLVVVYVARTERDTGALARATVVVAAPCLIVGGLLAWYNWARFGSITEFGTSYQLLGEDVRLARANELDFIPRGLFQYLVSPPRTESAWPWFRLRLLSFPIPTEQNYLLEPIAGVVVGMPAAFAGLVAYPWAWAGAIRRQPWLTALLVTLVGIGAVTLVLLTYHFHGATMRYELDFVPPILFASVLGGAAAIARWTGTRRSFALVGTGLGLVLVGWSIFFLVNITSYPCAGLGSC